MNDPLKQFAQLRVSLTAEKEKLEARLALLNKTLGEQAPSASSSSAHHDRPPSNPTAKRAISASTRAKMRAAQQRRWAKVSSKAAAPASSVPPKAKGKAKSTARAHNALSLREAIRQVVKVKPLDRKEILTALAKIGYKSNSSNPMNLLSSVLYRKGAGFRSKNGKFSAA